MEYQIVYSSEIYEHFAAIRDLQDKVRELIKHGWQPQGGVSIVFSSYSHKYVATQAMIKSR